MKAPNHFVFLVLLSLLFPLFMEFPIILPENNHVCPKTDLTPTLPDNEIGKELRKTWKFWGNISEPERIQQVYLIEVLGEFAELHNLTWFLYAGQC